MFKKKKKEDTRDHRGRTNNIINNNYNGVEFCILDTMKFSVSDAISEDDEETNINPEIVDFIDNAVSTNEEFKKFNVVTEIKKPNGTTTLKNYYMKKTDYNALFEYLVNKKEFTDYELYVTISYYFSIDKTKLFDYLSNVYKEKIIKKFNLPTTKLY